MRVIDEANMSAIARSYALGNIWSLIRVLILAIVALALCSGCAARGPEDRNNPSAQFVRVEGQPEVVPAEWVATVPGRLAHSIKTPNPLPKDSGYRAGMSSEQYFEHLCKTESGDFIFKTVANVGGLYFMRPPNRPTDADLMDRYKLEAPGIERTFQLMRPNSEERAELFINPPWARFSFMEEPNQSTNVANRYVRIYGYKQRVSTMKVEGVDDLKSNYGLLWRGVKRAHDRELNISGSEWIVIDLATNEVLALQRDYARTGITRNAPGGIWWLNAINCPGSTVKQILGSQIYDFVIKSLEPARED